MTKDQQAALEQAALPTRITDQEAMRQYGEALVVAQQTSNRDPAKRLWREHPALRVEFAAMAEMAGVKFLPEWRERQPVYEFERPI